MTYTVQTPAGTAEFPDSMTPEEIQAVLTEQFPTPKEASTGEILKGLDKQAAAGAIQGAAGLVSAIPNLAGGLERGADWLWNRFMPAGPAGPRPTGLAAPGGLGTAAGGAIDQAAKELADSQAGAPTTPAERAARTVGGYVGSGVLGGVGPVRSAIGGLGDVAAGAATEGTAAEPYARAAGGILAGSLPGVGRRIATPLPISPERQAAIATLEKAGVPVTAGEASGSKALRYAEAALSDAPFAGGKAAAIKEAQGQALAGEVMGKTGAPSELMTRENMEKGFDRLGQTYQDIGTRNNLNFDPKLSSDVLDSIKRYEDIAHFANNKPIIYKEAAKIANAIQSGSPSMSGIQYQKWRSDLGKLSSGLSRSGDEAAAQGIKDIRKSLDSAFERSMSNPADAALLKETNRQYSALKGVKKGIERGGGDPLLGLLGQNPGATLRAMATGPTGHRGFIPLSDAANTILKPLPNSGTAQRLNMLSHVPAVAADVWTAMHGGIPYATLVRGTATAGIGRVLMSDLFQNYLKNQRFAKQPRGQALGPQGLALPALLANPGILSQLQLPGQ